MHHGSNSPALRLVYCAVAICLLSVLGLLLSLRARSKPGPSNPSPSAQLDATIEPHRSSKQLLLAREIESAQSTKTDCHWNFIEYRSSEYEKHWIDNIASLQDNVCAESNKQAHEIEEWMAHAKKSTAQRTTDLPETIFSKFSFQNNCTGEMTTDYIEPLAGLTRSPFYCKRGLNTDDVMDKDYIIISWNVSRKRIVSPWYNARYYYFDLGASLYNSGMGGASQSWIVQAYEDRGVLWDGIFGWEAIEHRPSSVWEIIPPHLKPIYHWYNIPVSSQPKHPDNALEYIRRHARPQDYVLLKLDIDHTLTEEALVEQILGSEELLALIDEFIFEHHVNVGPMNAHWGTYNVPHRLQDTYRIFSTLRRKGILAHSWV